MTIMDVLAEIDARAERFADLALNPDRSSFIRDRELHRRQELLSLRDFIEGGTE